MIGNSAMGSSAIVDNLGRTKTSTTTYPPLTMDNNTAHGLSTGKMVAKQPKAVDMRFHWLKCRETQHQFNIRWEKGSCNRAD
eukprot:6635122-Ditylum_brightwellii.AAC.1